ncbi:hypothetical protein FI667_g14558, partial [Globisporangium splendens]
MATTTKRKRGRPPLPPCAPTEPYAVWPAAQLLAECVRRGISVRRKGARANNSKAGLAELLEQFDADHQSRVSVREQQLPSPSVATTRSYEYRRSIGGEDDRPLHEQQNARDAAMTVLLDGAMDEAAEAEIDEEDAVVLPQSPRNKKTRREDVDAHDYSSTFRLVNVLFTSYTVQFAVLCDVKSAGEDIATRSLWSNVAAAYHSQNPLYARMICQDHAMFCGVNPLFRQRSRWQSLARTWHQMCRIYSSAMDQLRQTKADEMARFYSFCGGRLDVLYLHLWLLLKPQFASHFVLQEQPAPRRDPPSSSRSEDAVEPTPASIASTNQTEHGASRNENDAPISPRRQSTHAQDPSLDPCLAYDHSPVLVSEESSEPQADTEASSMSQIMDDVTRTASEASQPRRQKPHTPHPCPHCCLSSIHGREGSHQSQADTEASLTLQTQVLQLKLQVLREKRQLGLEHAEEERQRIRDERRRRLLQDVREVATTIAELQTRLEHQQLRVVHGTGDSARAYLADLERDAAFFTHQKRRLMADLLEDNSSGSNSDDEPLR